MFKFPEMMAKVLFTILWRNCSILEKKTSQKYDGVLAAADRVSERAAGLLRRLAVETSEAESDDVIAGLVRTTADRVLRDLQHRARSAAAAEDRQAYATAIAWVKTRAEGLAERATREPNVDQLLPWLIEHAEGGSG